MTADDLVIATGWRPARHPGFDYDGEHVWSSTEALAPDRVPDHLLVIGAHGEGVPGFGRDDLTERLLLGCPGSTLIVPR